MVVVLILGGAFIHASTKTNVLNSASSSVSRTMSLSSMPAWWQGDDTDTDGDGIPDLWEKWTHGNPHVADSNLDRDEDGLSDLGEFQNQTDPRTADTDGDGLSDYIEISNGIDPITPADFTPNEPDINDNGVIDLWEGAFYHYDFYDTDGNGFDDRYEFENMPPASDSNFDVVVDVYTSRSAVLTWTNPVGSGGIVLMATTGTDVKQTIVGKCQGFIPRDVNLRFTSQPVNGRTKHTKIIVVGDINTNVLNAVGFTPQEYNSWRNADPYGYSYVYIERLRLNPCVEKISEEGNFYHYKGYDPKLFPFNDNDLMHAAATTATHETGHMLGLVDETLYGTEGHHNRPSKDFCSTWIMNKDRSQMQRFGKADAPSTWKPLNLDYIKFILPTELE